MPAYIQFTNTDRINKMKTKITIQVIITQYYYYFILLRHHFNGALGLLVTKRKEQTKQFNRNIISNLHPYKKTILNRSKYNFQKFIQASKLSH